jgi:putative nucleotidyltransferase with HDIG domain
MAATLVEPTAAFAPVALDGLVGQEPLAFPLYLGTGGGLPVLYRDEQTAFSEQHLARLRSEGVRAVFIREQDRALYCRRVERELDRLLRNQDVPIEHRASVLCGVAMELAQDLTQTPPSKVEVQRAQRMLSATSALVLRDEKAFAAVRAVLQARADLAHHSMVVSLFSLGLARHVIGGDAMALTHAGLAGLLHDVGRIGHEDDPEDGEHVRRAAELLVPAEVPRPVVDAVAAHHERMDGSGYPLGLRGPSIAILGRLVGMVDTFATIYCEGKARVGAFEALRIVGEVYRGCFDEKIAVALVRTFR